MQVNHDVKLTETVSRIPQLYKEFSMEIDILIPLKTRYKDYLNHPQCDAKAVTKLIKQGESIESISTMLGASEYIVKQVLRALDMRPDPSLRPPVDLLHHPKIDFAVVSELREQGKTIVEIAAELHVAKKLLQEVLRAHAENGQEISRLAPRARPSFPTKVDYSNHPIARPEVIRNLISEGEMSITRIAKRLGLATATARKAVWTLQAKDPTFPQVARRISRRPDSHSYFLQHPKCSANDILSFREIGYTKKQIARKLGVSVGTVDSVLLAVRLTPKS